MAGYNFMKDYLVLFHFVRCRTFALKINIFYERIFVCCLIFIRLPAPIYGPRDGNSGEPLSARIDALIEHKLPAGSNVAIRSMT